MIWTSELEPVVVDDTTVGAAIAHAARSHPDRPALVDGPSGKAVTYRELARRIDRIAAWLYADGLRPGDCVAMWAPNVPPVAACTLAAMGLGAAVTGLNPAWSDDEVATQLGDADASVLVTVPDLAEPGPFARDAPRHRARRGGRHGAARRAAGRSSRSVRA